jgi:hypothetical protein
MAVNAAIININTNVNTQPITQATAAVNQLQQSANGASTGFTNMSNGAKKLGDGLKNLLAAGGVLAIFSKLKDVFMQNQRVADLLATGMETINIIFNQVVNVVMSVIDKVSKATDGFEGLGNVLKGGLMISINVLKVSFNGLILIFQELQLAWEESFFGKKDKGEIDRLNKKIEDTKTNLKEAGEEIVKNGKLIGDNIGKAIDEVGQVVEGVVDGISTIDVKAAAAQAEALVRARENAKTLVATQDRLIAGYERQAEKQRQIRDNDEENIKVRVEANNKLMLILQDEKAAIELKNKALIKIAEAEFRINGNKENERKLTEAKTAKEKELADVEGKMSEQLENKNSLEKQGIKIVEDAIKGNETRAIKQKEFDASMMKDESLRLETQKNNLKDLQDTELKRLEENITKHKEGTQAKVDAENEYKNRKQEIANQIISIDEKILDAKKKLAEEEIKLNNEILDNKIAASQKELDNLKATSIFSYNAKKELYDKERDLLLQKSANERKAEIDGAKGNKDAIAAINAKFDENDKETRRVNSEQKLTELTEEIGKGIELMSAANDAFQALSSIGDQRREQELSGLEKENEALDKKKQKDIELLDSQNLTDEQRVAAKNNINKKYFAIEKANFDKMEKIKKEQFESNKKNQIASAIINTASAVVQALGSMPPPASFIMAALAGVAGIAQVIKISETKYEGGTPPELSKITAAASGVKSAGSAIPSSGQINNIKTIPKIQEEGLKYTKVYVTTEDINQVSSKAEVIQNRATK